jgi:hypothetical protein
MVTKHARIEVAIANNNVSSDQHDTTWQRHHDIHGNTCAFQYSTCAFQHSTCAFQHSTCAFQQPNFVRVHYNDEGAPSEGIDSPVELLPQRQRQPLRLLPREKSSFSQLHCPGSRACIPDENVQPPH